jgi:hypothetical protein
LPDEVLGLTVPDLASRSITIVVTLKGPHGKTVQVPVVWHPETNVVKKLHPLSWAKLGVTERLSRLRDRIIKMAKKEHRRLLERNATRDMFGDGHEES